MQLFWLIFSVNFVFIFFGVIAANVIVSELGADSYLFSE